MIELKRHGSYLNIDESGFVVPSVDNESVQDKWMPIITDVVDFYLNKFGNNLHSVYIRGSVAKGEAVEYISDLDSYSVLKNDPGEVDTPFSEEFQTEMNKKYPYCNLVEISFIHKDEIGKDFPPRKRSVWAELIKTQSICVYGANLAAEIQPFMLNDMIGHSYYIESELKKLPEYFKEDTSEEIIDTCVWISRRLVRSGFDLVMEREKKFTRDLYLCYESFAKYYPEKKDAMYDVLNLSLNPINSTTQINNVISKISTWLVNEINNRLK